MTYLYNGKNLIIISWEYVKKSQLKPLIKYDDFVEQNIYQEKIVENEITSTNKDWEKVIVHKEQIKTLVPIMQEKVIKSKKLIEWEKNNWNKTFTEIEIEETILVPKTEKVMVEKVYNPNPSCIVVDDDYFEINEEEYQKISIWFWKEKPQEKSTDQKQAQEVIFKGQFLVNITTKGKKKIATIHDAKTADENASIELDEERGDKSFDTIEEAKAYAESFA